jgi:uncharacterized RDD family membrane protein YckC
MTDRRYGGFWRRYIAYLIDKIVLYFASLFLLVVGILALGNGGVSLGRIMATGDIPCGMGLFTIVYAVALFITDMTYFTWFHGSVGQTPGKMVMGLRVIQASGDKMTFGVAFLRCAGSLASALVLWLGYLWIAIDGRKQGWHDKIAATLVVRAEDELHERSSPAATVYPSPDSPPTAPDSADARIAGPLPPTVVSVSNTDIHEGTSAAQPQADRNATGPAGSAPGDLPGRG